MKRQQGVRSVASVVAVMAVAVGTAGCGGASRDSGPPAVATAVPAGVAAPKVPNWVPARLAPRVVKRAPDPHAPGCGIFYDGRDGRSSDVYVSRGARCQTGLLVLADLDGHLSKGDLTSRCDYQLCDPQVRGYRGYRCRLVHAFDDDYEFLCERGSRKIGFGFGG
jgi:hypothetical protein